MIPLLESDFLHELFGIGSDAIGAIDATENVVRVFSDEKYKAEVRWFLRACEIGNNVQSGVLIATTDSVYYGTGTIIEDFRLFYSWDGNGNPFANPVSPEPLV